MKLLMKCQKMYFIKYNDISHMLQKTGCKNRTELAIEARVQGLVVGDTVGSK